MKKLALISLLLIAACAPFDRQGSGITTGGEDIHIVRRVENFADEFTLTVGNTTCHMRLEHKPYTRIALVHNVPMTCDKGVTGTAVVSYDSQIRGEQGVTAAKVNFRLSNGKIGNAAA